MILETQTSKYHIIIAFNNDDSYELNNDYDIEIIRNINNALSYMSYSHNPDNNMKNIVTMMLLNPYYPSEIVRMYKLTKFLLPQ
jgi:hypothetical protein